MKGRVGSALVLIVAVVASAMLVAACQPVRPAPIVDREPPPSRKIDYHYVSRGETLFDIAWRYELDMDTLAQVNNIPAPYHLRPGQRLNLDLRGERARTGGRTVTASGVVVHAAPDAGGLRVVDTPEPPLQTGPRDEETVPPVADTRQPESVSPSSREPEAAPETPVSAPRPTQPEPAPAEVLASGEIDWRWPIEGQVSRHHDSAGVLKGVDIKSREGVPVNPAAPGIVVYAGEGLRGYGRLIIIKHSNEYLTAYAHNRLILVDEGVSVTRDTVIAEVGGDIERPGTLYFEVRRDGKPIDPMEVMPPPRD